MLESHVNSNLIKSNTASLELKQSVFFLLHYQSQGSVLILLLNKKDIH